MPDLSLVTWSLDRVADRHGDPTKVVYEALFRAEPDAEKLFLLDRSGAVRGNMLAHVFDVIFDLAGPRAYGAHMIRSEAQNHVGLGVESSLFISFFPILRDAIKGLLQEEWTPQVDASWNELLSQASAAALSAEVRT